MKKISVQAIKDKINDWIDKNNTEVVGGALFNNDKNGQVLLFNKFGVCNQNNLTLKSDITQHYTEDNLFINDHWAINSPQYMLSGLIGELIYTRPTNLTSKIESLYSKSGLGILAKLSPVLGNYTSSVLNIVTHVNSIVDRYSKIARQGLTNWKSNGSEKTNQRRVLDELEKLMNIRTLVNVYTPYGTYNNLAIIAINVRQNANTKYNSDIEITFQKWRTPSDVLGKDEEPIETSEVAEAQKSEEVDKSLVGANETDKTVEDLG